MSAWHQMTQIIECPACLPAKGRIWRKNDRDGQPVDVAAEPCEKHQRMLERQGWVQR